MGKSLITMNKSQIPRKSLRIAIIGCGEHSSENLVPALAQMPNVTVKAVCDLDEQHAANAAKRFAPCDVEVDWKKVVFRKDIDAIVVAATPQIHFQASLEALSRGIHVFVEKPPTTNSPDLRKLSEIAVKSRLVTCVGHNLRHSTAAIEMQSVISGKYDSAVEDATFGLPIAMEMRYDASKPRGDRWGLNSPLRSFLLSHANHAIDFMIYQMGPIRRVNAALATVSAESDGVALSVQFKFESGAVGNLLATSCVPHFSISGSVISNTNRKVQLNSLHEVIAHGIGRDEKRWGRCWTTRSLLTGYESAGYLTELDCFVSAAIENNPNLCHPSFSDEVAVYDAIDQIESKIQESR